MPGWTLTETHPTHGRTFQRPLDGVELVFFWDGVFNGTTDNLHPVELRLLNHSQDAHLFADGNIVKAWLSTKRRYPLAGATLQVMPGTPTTTGYLGMADPKPESSGDDALKAASGPHFVVREHDLAVLHPNEIIFEQVGSAEEVQQRVADILDGPRPLSHELLAQLYVFREADPERVDVLHLMTLAGHCVTDGMANRTFMRSLLDTIARGGDPASEPTQLPLEERLAMVVPPVDLAPMHLRSFGQAKRRWRLAIAGTIHQLRMKRGQGGHTLPCRQTRTTPYTPARSGFVSTVLTEPQTSSVLINCRLYGLTFGNAYLALAQVAMTRVLYRRYLHGEISEEEWAYRKRQPYRNLGPINARPYLDGAWFERGGGGEFMASTCASITQLPFMTLGGIERCRYHELDLSDGAPPLSDLLSFDRFLHRAALAKKQAKAFLDHPLFLEIGHMGALDFSRYSHHLALEWTKHSQTAEGIDTGDHSGSDDEVLAATDIPWVVSHGGSSLGNVNLIFPTEYPLPPTHPLSPLSPVRHPSKAGYVYPPPMDVDATPRIVVENAMTRLHLRPAELYLGALTWRSQLNMYVFYDRNVYEHEVVKEWLDEVRGAVLWYLGQSHRPRHEQRGHDGSDAFQA